MGKAVLKYTNKKTLDYLHDFAKTRGKESWGDYKNQDFKDKISSGADNGIKHELMEFMAYLKSRKS